MDPKDILTAQLHGGLPASSSERPTGSGQSAYVFPVGSAVRPPMSQVFELNQQQFEAEVLQSELPVVVDFYATWCPPCRMLAPILNRLATEFDGQIKFVKVNSDDEPRLAAQYNVTGLPTIVLFEHGKIVGQFAGLPQETAFRNELRKWVGSALLMD